MAVTQIQTFFHILAFFYSVLVVAVSPAASRSKVFLDHYICSVYGDEKLPLVGQYLARILHVNSNKKTCIIPTGEKTDRL